MIRNADFDDVNRRLAIMIHKCEGAMMASKGGSYLHNFAFMIQEEIRSAISELDNATDREKYDERCKQRQYVGGD